MATFLKNILQTLSSFKSPSRADAFNETSWIAGSLRIAGADPLSIGKQSLTDKINTNWSRLVYSITIFYCITTLVSMFQPVDGGTRMSIAIDLIRLVSVLYRLYYIRSNRSGVTRLYHGINDILSAFPSAPVKPRIWPKVVAVLLLIYCTAQTLATYKTVKDHYDYQHVKYLGLFDQLLPKNSTRLRVFVKTDIVIRSLLFRMIFVIENFLFSATASIISHRSLVLSKLFTQFAKQDKINFNAVTRFSNSFRQLNKVLELLDQVYASGNIIWYLLFVVYTVSAANEFSAIGGRPDMDSRAAFVSFLPKVVLPFVMLYLVSVFIYEINDHKEGNRAHLEMIAARISLNDDPRSKHNPQLRPEQLACLLSYLNSDHGTVTCSNFFEIRRRVIPKIVHFLVVYLFMSYQVHSIMKGS